MAKSITISVDDELHKTLRIRAVKNNSKIYEEYISYLLHENESARYLSNKNENKFSLDIETLLEVHFDKMRKLNNDSIKKGLHNLIEENNNSKSEHMGLLKKQSRIIDTSVTELKRFATNINGSINDIRLISNMNKKMFLVVPLLILMGSFAINFYAVYVVMKGIGKW